MKYLRLLVFTMMTLALHSVFAQNQELSWEEIKQMYVSQLETLNAPDFNIYYVDNLKSIPSKESVLLQQGTIDQLATQLTQFEDEILGEEDQIDFELMKYILKLNQFRIALELSHLESQSESISEEGVFHVKNGKNWYRYLLKHWVDLSVEPEELMAFGKKEVARVEKAMEEIIAESGMNKNEFLSYLKQDEFFVHSSKEIKAGFEKMRHQVQQNLEEYFPFLEDVPKVKINQGTFNPQVQVPAYYMRHDSTFYYNFDGKPYDTRQYGWIYMHEGMPGHHYQIMLTRQRELSEIKKMHFFSGYREGWAAYIEELGSKLGAYEDIYQEYSKWEWDIIRSVRVVLDVGINFYGWTDEESLDYWRAHIKQKDDIAMREINRMRRWPAQVITYKYGADRIKQWKREFLELPTFSEKEFHRMIVENGDLPFSVLQIHVENNFKKYE